jgi:predicted RNase H-like HicB family nuclease
MQITASAIKLTYAYKGRIIGYKAEEVINMKSAYPIIMTQGQEYIVVYIPDFKINTQGSNIAEAIEMARDAIGIMGIDMEDENEALPEPSPLAAIMKENEMDIVSLVDVDFSEYRRKNDMRAVKKNCTIPSWLNFEAEKQI